MAMDKKAFMAVFIASLLLASLEGVLSVNVAKANPINAPALPNTDLPTLRIEQPQNYSAIYAQKTLKLNLTVITPTSWDSYKQPYGFP